MGPVADEAGEVSGPSADAAIIGTQRAGPETTLGETTGRTMVPPLAAVPTVAAAGLSIEEKKPVEDAGEGLHRAESTAVVQGGLGRVKIAEGRVDMAAREGRPKRAR